MMTLDELDALLERPGLPELGRALLRAGLTERAVLACYGVAAIGQIARGRRYDHAPPPAAVAPWLLCAGGALDAALAARALGPALTGLEAAGLVERDGARLRARVAIAPAGGHGALAASDRLDAAGDDVVLGPDDSSHHLVSALPGRRVATWLDLATGAAWAPLAAAGRAAAVTATDRNPRAIAMARLGAALSGVAIGRAGAGPVGEAVAGGVEGAEPTGAPAARPWIELAVADLFAPPPAARFDLVSCNAPMPSGAGPRHRVAAGVVARIWEIAPGLVAPGGELVVHAAGEPPALPGEVVIARYTPPGAPAFAIVACRPDRPPDRRVVEITLTPGAPHVPRSALVSA
jgi:hypothetical protein